MHPSTAVLLLIFTHAVSSEPNCVQIPDVPNAELQNGKESYAKGDTIVFTCVRGYTSGRPIKHICTDSGWISLQKLTCRLKPCVLPDDISNGYYQFTHGDDFVFGTTIKYFCNEGYQMISKEDTRTCYVDGWSNHLPVCEPLSCEAPAVPGLVVEGLPFDDGPILPDRFLTFSCPPGFSRNGSQTLVCGQNGTWDAPFPNCVEVVIACVVPASDHRVRVSGAAGATVPAGGWVTVQCVRSHRSEQVQCLPSGQWSPFPTCSHPCDVVGVSDTVLVSPRNVRQLQTGQSLRFRCRIGSHVLNGAQQVTCEDGAWSQPLPSCSEPRGCGTPPPLENGDFLASTTEFGHNTRVLYECQSKYTIEGGPYKTCFNGQWTGEITCLKPCTVNEALMEPNKLDFRWKDTDKLYAPHNDFLTFRCERGATHDGVVAMRQQCVNGKIELPRCV